MALDKLNPVDKAEFVAMQALVGASGAGAATTTTFGTVKKAASQPAAAGANPTKAEYDALVAALKTAGIMVSP